MNFSSLVGFAMAVATVWFCVINESPNPALLLDPKGFVLVLGGSMAAGLIIYPVKTLLRLWKVILFGVIFKRAHNRRKIVRELVAAAALDPSEHPALMMYGTSHPFLAEGLRLIAEDALNVQDLQDVLTRRSMHFKQTYMQDAKVLATLAKFPSAFGMLGSTVGLIDMMTELGGEKGQAGIGPAMAMALVATFWGLVFTYMILMPLSDYAVRLAGEDALIRNIITDGLVMIKQHKDPHIVLEKLNGFLNIGERMAIKNRETMEGATWEQVRDEIERLRKRA